MKTMRKLFTVLLALAMTLALAVTAFAETGSITITNPQGDHTYTAYKIFDVTYTADGVNYSYTISDTDAAFSTVKAYADVTANGLNLTAVANTNKYNVSIGAGFSAASFAQHLKTNEGSLGTGKAFTTTTDGKAMKASDLALGYYFVSSASGTVCELATAKDIKIRDKNEAPQIEKTVNDDDLTVEIGQKLTYTITGKVPSTTGYKEFTYKVTDTMSEGLTYNKDAKVTIDGTDVTATITNNDDNFVASVNMMNYQDKIDKTVVITYTATVNEKAIQSDKETNTATLQYSNNPADNTSSDKTTVKVDVFSFNIVIDKYAAGSESTKLEGAKFVLKNAEGKYYKYNDATKTVTWVNTKAEGATEVSTKADGSARFDGLEAGTYSLEETAAPAGYNQLTKDITIVITNKDTATVAGSASNPAAADLSLTAKVANSTGTMLPETGGTGTVIFVVLGALAVICAGVFLVTNKRMSKESF